jgi:hypothetical protein
MTLKEMMLDPDIDQQAIEDTLEAIDGAVEEKADSYAHIIAELDVGADMLKKEIDRLAQKKQFVLNNKERLRCSLLNAMKNTGKVKFKTDTHSFYISHSVSVEITDEAKIPDKYKSYEAKIDKNELKKDLSEDLGIEGAELKEGESVVIK